jgi:hypothetical protein
VKYIPRQAAKPQEMQMAQGYNLALHQALSGKAGRTGLREIL